MDRLRPLARTCLYPSTITNRQIRSRSDIRPSKTKADMKASLRLPFAGRVSGREGMMDEHLDGNRTVLYQRLSVVKGDS